MKVIARCSAKRITARKGIGKMGKNFSKLTKVQQENILMLDILKLLQQYGGSLTRDEINQRLPNIDERITPEYINFEKKTKSGGTNRPFVWSRNFAIKHLGLADFLTYQRAQPVTLTHKGISFNVSNFDAERDVRSISEPKMKELSEQNKVRKAAKQSKNFNIDVLDEEDENVDFKTKLLESISKMPPIKFEQLCRKILNKMDVEIDKNIGVQYVADGGIDGFGYYVGDDFRTVRIAIQAKRWQGPVGAPEIQKFIGAISNFDAEYGVFITNSYFTASAKEAARKGRHTVTLIDQDKLVKLICKLEIGVKSVTTYKMIDDIYFDN